MTVQHFKKAMGKRLKNSRKSAQGWGKMGKNGEKWGKNFMGKAFYDWQFSPFFPIFPHLKKNFERRSVFFKMA